MKHAASLLRRGELVELMRDAAPRGYDYTPRNRQQRRLLARKLRQAPAKKPRR